MWEALGKIYSDLFKGESRILDVGTGFCNNLSLLLKASPRAEIYSIDPDPAALERAKRRFGELVEEGRLKLYLAKAENLPFPNEYFDYAAAAATMHHIADKEKALRGIARVLDSEGLAVIADWNPEGWVFTPHSFEELEESREEVFKNLDTYFEIIKVMDYREYYIVVAKPKL